VEERDVIVVGAGPAGLSAAMFVKLDGWNTLLFEGGWVGGQGAIAYTVSNYPGFLPGDGAVLLENMEKQATSPPPAGAGVELRRERVNSIDADRRTAVTDNGQYQAQAIVLATGSSMQRLGVPGEDKFVGKGVSYYAKRDVEKFRDKRILVVGGGNTTAKSALLAKSVGGDVTLVHRRESLRAYPGMVKRLEAAGVAIWYDSEVREIQGGEEVRAAVVANNKTGEEREVAVDWLVICVGTEPDTRLARAAGLEMDGNYVRVDRHMMTSRPGVFACGEITGGERHLITAASEGALAGMATSEYLALEKVKRDGTFVGAKNGKYADEYLAMIRGS
jgi:thioredoxin reductase (NADPH)